MAKVKKAETNLKPGKPQSAPSPKGNKNSVVAVRNGIERTFPRNIWDHLPADKAGFKEAVSMPEAPKTKSPEPTNYDEAVKAYTEAFGEAPGQDLTIEDINAAIADKN